MLTKPKSDQPAPGANRRTLELDYWRAELLGPERDAFVETFLGYQRTRLRELESAWAGAAIGGFDPAQFDAIEIGCGPIPALGVAHWKSARAIDPLADAYREHGLWVDPSGSVESATANGETLPIENASADLVVCENALDHVGDPAAVCAETARVLRPGGVLWLLVDEMDFNDELHTGLSRHDVDGLVARAGLERLFQEVKPTKSHPMASGQVRTLWLKPPA